MNTTSHEGLPDWMRKELHAAGFEAAPLTPCLNSNDDAIHRRRRDDEEEQIKLSKVQKVKGEI